MFGGYGAAKVPVPPGPTSAAQREEAAKAIQEKKQQEALKSGSSKPEKGAPAGLSVQRASGSGTAGDGRAEAGRGRSRRPLSEVDQELLEKEAAWRARRKSASSDADGSVSGESVSGSRSVSGSQYSLPQTTPSGHQLTVKNTFIEVVEDDQDEAPKMVRSYSDSNLTASSSAKASESKQSSSKLDQEKRGTTLALSSGLSSLTNTYSDQESSCASGSSVRDESTERAPGDQGARQAEEAMWSIGSELHEQGQCKPCLYIMQDSGCMKGAKCTFCHVPHKRKARQRPCKSTRSQCKRTVALLEEVFDKDPSKMMEVSKQLAGQSHYMKQILKGKQDEGAASSTKMSL